MKLKDIRAFGADPAKDVYEPMDGRGDELLPLNVRSFYAISPYELVETTAEMMAGLPFPSLPWNEGDYTYFVASERIRALQFFLVDAGQRLRGKYQVETWDGQRWVDVHPRIDLAKIMRKGYRVALSSRWGILDAITDELVEGYIVRIRPSGAVDVTLALPTTVITTAPLVYDLPQHRVTSVVRISPCYNRRQAEFRFWVRTPDGAPVYDELIGLTTEASHGVIYSPLRVWGPTSWQGYAVYRHTRIPTRYVVWIDYPDQVIMTNLATDLGNQYCRGSWLPQNQPGVYSYDVYIEKTE